jgi:hypothetical protein
MHWLVGIAAALLIGLSKGGLPVVGQGATAHFSPYQSNFYGMPGLAHEGKRELKRFRFPGLQQLKHVSNASVNDLKRSAGIC